MSQNKSNTPKKHEVIDQLILAESTTFPEKSFDQIGQELQQVGVYNHPKSIYKRLTHSEYLRVELAKLKERVRENTIRVMFPLAEKRVKKALKNKDLDEKTLFPYIKLIYDKTLGEDFQGIINQTVNINQLQQVVNQSLSNRE